MGDIIRFLWLLNIVSTFILLGLILVIQFVHYPSFFWISEKKFKEFTSFHTRSISIIVAPLMVTEILMASFLILIADNHWSVRFINLFSIVLIWCATFFFSIPCHQKLSLERNEVIIRDLIRTNWYRTILWGMRSLFLLFIIKDVI